MITPLLVPDPSHPHIIGRSGLSGKRKHLATSAKNLYDTAKVETSIQTHQDASDVISGHFRQGPRYSVYRPRGTGDWLLIYTVAGAGRVGHHDGNGTKTAGETIVRRGDALLFRPDVYHDYRTADIGTAPRWELLWAHFQPRTQWLDWLDWPTIGREGIGVISVGRAGMTAVEAALRAVVRSGRSSRPRAEAFAMNALELALLQLDRWNPVGTQGGLDPRLQRVMEACCQDLRRRWTVRSMAELATVSESRFAHLFREEVGTTPLRYLERQRLARGAQLLRWSSLSIKEIAHEVGFASPFYFSLRFKAETGNNPRAFRSVTAR